MSNATNVRRDEAATLVSGFRELRAWSQTQLAEQLGVSRVTVARWELGTSKPSALALTQLEALSQDDTKFKKESSSLEASSKTSKKLSFSHRKVIRLVKPSPFVLNGPKDQNEFHKLLIELQEHKLASPIEWDIYQSRLSLVESGEDEPTAQFVLEAPGQGAKSWSSNYGPHGWHRYVGRFPPHLVRALLNHFQATPNGVVCDPFTGSGTTLVEARLLGIPSIGIEICPLSSLISRTKSGFPTSTLKLKKLVPELEVFFELKRGDFIKKQGSKFTHADVLKRKGNRIDNFVNIERWFTPTSLLGVSIVGEFAGTKSGFERELIITAISAKMRSIGNVDVDVIRAEYSKKPRENVDVLRLVRNHLLKMISDIDNSISSHHKTIGTPSSVTLKETSVLNADLPKGSISYIITSPPYGVESLSYLRTHLLSYRTLGSFLKTDPYEFGKKVIGSEYLPKEAPDALNLSVSKVSKTYRDFFKSIADADRSKTSQVRVSMMMHFFQDMEDVAKKFNFWVKKGGKIAFVVGNKRIEDDVIPTDIIISEIFASQNMKLKRVLGHKLKTNNSNSRVPWQDRIIDQEFVMIFQKT